ncbi:autophagy-related protein 16 isoform X2 [Puntigrus tetrazona]|nr:autophagy-related protein 16 isoform X2 [Puntigrus tetrazona]
MLTFHAKPRQGTDTCRSRDNGSSGCPDEGGTLYLRVNELEFLNQQLKQKISDLTSNIYLKDAELQYCHSQVARYRTEAVVLAQGAHCLKADLQEHEYQLECQSKDLTALRLDHGSLREQLMAANLQNERLLDRWLEEKKEEAERINKYNATQERWQRLAGRLKKRHRVRARAECAADKPTDYKTQRPLS